MIVRPLGDRILLQKTEVKLKSGIALPQDMASGPTQGKVLGVGPKVENKDIKEGDELIYARYSPSGMTIEGKDLLFVAERDILGIIDGWTQPISSLNALGESL